MALNVLPPIVSINLTEAVKRALVKRGYRLHLHSAAENVEPGVNNLRGIALRTHDILFEARTVWPFDLFRDSVIIDREKLTVITRYFFEVAKVISVPIRDILSIEANVGPFFGSVHITSRYYPVNPYSVNFLWRRDTLKLQRLLQGYIIAHEQKVDCSNIEKGRLLTYLYDLGQGDPKQSRPTLI